MAAISKTRRQRDEVGKVVDPPSSILCQALSALRHALLAFCVCQSVESLIAVDSFLWKIRAGRPQPRDFFSIWSRTRKFKEIMRNRVKAFAAVIVVVFCVFVRRSLGRVIKYSNEYQFDFGLEKFGVVKDSVF